MSIYAEDITGDGVWVELEGKVKGLTKGLPWLMVKGKGSLRGKVGDWIFYFAGAGLRGALTRWDQADGRG